MRWNTYIARKILESGGYGMLYNWYCTQEQAAVEYGYLYNWYAATDARNICSVGFHVPSSTEYKTMADYLGASGNYATNTVGIKLKEVGLTHWTTPNTGATNETGFNGRGSGSRASTNGVFSGMGTIAWYLVSDNYMTDYSLLASLANSTDAIVIGFGILPKKTGGAIRPMKDSTTLTNGQTGTYVDPSGIIYPTICIGTQEWVACNIMTKHYRNGDAIPEVTDNTAWAALTIGARCSYNNTESNAGATKKISSSDEWVVPKLSDLYTLQSNAGGELYAGGKLKETGLTHWNDPNVGATNEYGFNARGAGYRNDTGTFSGLKDALLLWQSTPNTSTNAINGAIQNLYAYFTLSTTCTYSWGLSIRLLYTGSGTPTTYTGNDGTVYPVVLIGSQRWLAMNLKETKWSDGTDIQNITDNTAWSLLTEAACCDINNDPTLR